MQDPGAADSAIGDRYYNRKQYSEAIKYYASAVKKNPINAEHHFHLGNAYDCTLQHDLAIDAYTQCITLNGQNARYRYQRGVTWYFLGKFREALEDFEQALKLDPNHSEASRGCGLACKGIGAYSNALGYFRRALKVDPNNMMVYLSYAYTLKVVGQFPKMLQVFLDVVEIASVKIANTGQNSLSFDWLYGRQEAYKCLGLFDLAVSDCDWIVSICDQTGKDYRATFQNRAVALFKLGRLQEALRDINRAIQEGTMEDPDYPLVIRGDIYKALQHYPQALKDYTKALSLARHANTCAKIAQIYWILNDVGSALKYLDQAFQINENSKSALSYKATIVYSLGQYDIAAQLYQKILSIDPNNFEARDRLTRIMNETTPLQPVRIVITQYERLVRACCIGHLGKIRRLIEHFKIDIDPKTPMLYSRANVSNMRTKELMNVLNRLNVNLDGLTTREQLENATIGLPCVVLTPVVAAVLHGQVNVFKYLIDHDADLNRGVLMTPLMAAVHVVSQFGSKMIEDLLLNGANVNLLFKGTTALHVAASLNLDETCDLLLKYGADATILDENSKTATEVTSSALVQKVISKYLNNPVLNQNDLQKLSEKAQNETTDTNTYRRVCLQRTLMSMNKKEISTVNLRKKEDAVEFYDVSQRFTRHCAKTYLENVQVDTIQKIIDTEYEANHWHQKALMNCPTPNYETQYMFLTHKENFSSILENFNIIDFDERARVNSPDRLRDLVLGTVHVIVFKVCLGKTHVIPFSEKISVFPEGFDSVVAQSISSDGIGNLKSIHVSSKFQIIPLYQISCRIVGRIVQQSPPQTPILQHADTVSSCRVCVKQFSILRKKHHCHVCGFVYCNDCTSKRIELPNFGYVQAVRVCSDCFEKVTTQQTKRV